MPFSKKTSTFTGSFSQKNSALAKQPSAYKLFFDRRGRYIFVRLAGFSTRFFWGHVAGECQSLPLACHAQTLDLPHPKPLTCHEQRVSPATRGGYKSSLFLFSNCSFFWGGLDNYVFFWLDCSFLSLSGLNICFLTWCLIDLSLFVVSFCFPFWVSAYFSSICYLDSFFLVLILMLILHQKSFSMNAPCCWEFKMKHSWK